MSCGTLPPRGTGPGRCGVGTGVDRQALSTGTGPGLEGWERVFRTKAVGAEEREGVQGWPVSPTCTLNWREPYEDKARETAVSVHNTLCIRGG